MMIIRWVGTDKRQAALVSPKGAGDTEGVGVQERTVRLVDSS